MIFRHDFPFHPHPSLPKLVPVWIVPKSHPIPSFDDVLVGFMHVKKEDAIFDLANQNKHRCAIHAVTCSMPVAPTVVIIIQPTAPLCQRGGVIAFRIRGKKKIRYGRHSSNLTGSEAGNHDLRAPSLANDIWIAVSHLPNCGAVHAEYYPRGESEVEGSQRLFSN